MLNENIAGKRCAYSLRFQWYQLFIYISFHAQLVANTFSDVWSICQCSKFENFKEKCHLYHLLWSESVYLLTASPSGPCGRAVPIWWQQEEHCVGGALLSILETEPSVCVRRGREAAVCIYVSPPLGITRPPPPPPPSPATPPPTLPHPTPTPQNFFFITQLHILSPVCQSNIKLFIGELTTYRSDITN